MRHDTKDSPSVTEPDTKAIIDAIRQALLTKYTRPPQAEGWFNMKELREVMAQGGTPVSETIVRRRLREQGELWERKIVRGFAYYRLKKPSG